MLLTTSARGPLRTHLKFTLLAGLSLLLLMAALRLALLWYNRDMIGATPLGVFSESFINGLRFDLRLVAMIFLPLVFACLSVRLMAARRFHVLWLSGWGSLIVLLGLTELDFYREFHQRLNSLVFQYISEDSQTVLSMLWYGFPVARYLLLWALLSYLLWRWLRRLDHRNPIELNTQPAARAITHLQRAGVFIAVFLSAAVAARGTLEQGPPLRWGAAFTTDSLFANQLGLNGVLTLAEAAKARWLSDDAKARAPRLPADEARQLVREMLLTAEDQLIDADSAAVRRILTPREDATLPIHNVVVILMESFAGHYVGALGGEGNITPYFDQLSKEGLLFTRYFSNGTHTHQGMFATMTCFPNLPGFEYLMQQPEGSHKFSGLPQLLSARDYDDLYVYNGAFSWDNQSGFFGAQGMRNFIGRSDYIDPVFSDPTWGVSDQDMFDRAALELKLHYGDKPFYALLQTLSNHTPYALPENLPVKPVTEFGHLNEHLTAMRYSDWALGQFFEKAKQLPFYNDTLFVIVGDHGFGNPDQLTEMDLYRYHVPLLMIAPGIQQKFGLKNDIAGTQVDIVPTIMGRLGGPAQHQCWGRDLLSFDASEVGIGVIKPSGSDQTVAIINGDKLLVQPPDRAATLYRYRLNQPQSAQPKVDESERAATSAALEKRLDAFVQVATESLQQNTAGASQ